MWLFQFCRKNLEWGYTLSMPAWSSNCKNWEPNILLKSPLFTHYIAFPEVEWEKHIFLDIRDFKKRVDSAKHKMDHDKFRLWVYWSHPGRRQLSHSKGHLKRMEGRDLPRCGLVMGMMGWPSNRTTAAEGSPGSLWSGEARGIFQNPGRLLMM